MAESANMTRRGLIAASVAGGCALVLGGAGALAQEPPASYAETGIGNPGSDATQVQYGFLTALSRCSGCARCVEACRKGNALSDDVPDRRRVLPFERRRGRTFFISISCMHCADPACMRVCPAAALSKDANGVVRVDPSRCIGCKYCYQACPYGVPRYSASSMDKCDCCQKSGVRIGEEDPYCVRACKFGALKFGPLQDLLAQAGSAGRLIAEEGGPSCVVLGTE